MKGKHVGDKAENKPEQWHETLVDGKKLNQGMCE
jgi:hypothetical protein